MLCLQVIQPPLIGLRMVSADWLSTSSHMTAALHDVKHFLSSHLLSRWLRMNTGTWHLSPPLSLSLSLSCSLSSFLSPSSWTHTHTNTQMQAADVIIYCNRGKWLGGLSWSSESIPQKLRPLINEAGVCYRLTRKTDTEKRHWAMMLCRKGDESIKRKTWAQATEEVFIFYLMSDTLW